MPDGSNKLDNQNKDLFSNIHRRTKPVDILSKCRNYKKKKERERTFYETLKYSSGADKNKRKNSLVKDWFSLLFSFKGEGVTRKYDTLIHLLSYGWGGCDYLTISDYSSKQNNGKRGRLSLSHPLYHYKVIWVRESLTLY